MADYIDREKLLAKIDEAFFETDPDGKEQIGVLKCRAIIREIPAADVASVVRCKDCKYGEFVKRGSKYSCRKVEGLMNFCDFYCKDGVKKEGGT